MTKWIVAVDEAARRQGKLAPQLARCIETEVFRLGWPVGHALGREEALAAGFGVSLSVMREALAITERDGVTRRQRGRTGGVYVAEPAQQSVIMALGNYLISAGLTESQYSDGYALLNGMALRLATERCTAEAARAARELAVQPVESGVEAVWRRINQLHDCLLEMTGNRALQIFCAALVYSGMQRFFSALIHLNHAAALRFSRQILACSERQVENVIAGDLASAILIDRETVQCWHNFYKPVVMAPLDEAKAQQIAAGIAAVYHPEKPVKRADALVFRLQRDIVCGNFQPGARLESEPVLVKRYQVSRGALRDAIRALEQHGLVKMEEGRGGGLRVATPDPSEVVRSAVIYFRFLQLSADELGEMAGDLEMALATSAAQRVQTAGPEVIQAFSAAIHPAQVPRNRAEAQQNLEAIYAGLAEASGNPVMALVVQVLTAFLTITVPKSRKQPALNREEYERYLAQLQQVEDALRNGDAGLARRCLMAARQQDLALLPQTRDLRQLMSRLFA